MKWLLQTALATMVLVAISHARDGTFRGAGINFGYSARF
jgi:hypothetical protein